MEHMVYSQPYGMQPAANQYIPKNRCSEDRAAIFYNKPKNQ